MLAITHLVAGAGVALVVRRPASRTLAALGSHALLDGVDHDDTTVGVHAQGALAGAALAALAAAWGARSPVVLGGLAGASPDVEIAADNLILGHRLRYVFPSHWQLGQGPGKHPYRYPWIRVPIGVELAISLAGLAALCVLGARRRGAR